MASEYLIIAGTNKAGTTSFFQYLADHPQVGAAYVKQTFFFLDKAWQQHWGMKSIYDYEKGLDQFDLFFKQVKEEPFKLEATPDYLYAPDCPARIAEFLQGKTGKIIFILRDPVKRFISLFYFGKQQGLLPAEMTFKSFRKKSMAYDQLDNMSLLAYQTGFYSNFIRAYYQHFDSSRVLIYFFEDLIKEPSNYMENVARDIGLEPGFYRQYDFTNHNTTVSVKSRKLEDAYNRLRSFLMHSVYKTKLGYNLINVLKGGIKPIYDRINKKPLEKEIIPEEEIKLLKELYVQEAIDLAHLIGREVPWALETPIS